MLGFTGFVIEPSVGTLKLNCPNPRPPIIPVKAPYIVAPAARPNAAPTPGIAPAAAATSATPPVAEQAPTIRKIDQPEPEAIDLLQAGSPVLKRAVPVLGVAIGALIVYGLVRRRRRK